MAWLVGDGFDFYNSGSNVLLNPAVWQSVSLGPVSQPGGRFGTGRYMTLGNGGSFGVTMTTVQFANSTTIWINANINSSQPHVNSGTTGLLGFVWLDTTSFIQGGIFLRNGGDFVVTSGAIGGTPLAAASSVLFPSANVWHHVQIKIVVHNTTGSVELRVDGHTSADYLVTGINTRNGNANFFANVIQAIGSSPSNDFYDDFYVFNDQGVQPNTWQGDVFCIQQVPATDVLNTWTRNSGSNNCLAVDDGAQDGDTTYVATNVVNNVDTYTITPLITTPAAIIAVTLRYMARMDDAGPHAVTAQLKSGPTVDTLPNYVTSNQYGYQQKVYSADPNTGAPWAGDAVNALQLSIKDVL